MISLPPGTTLRLQFVLGEAAEPSAAAAMAARYRAADAAALLQRVVDGWDRVLGTLTVETPDTATNIMLNRWLLYQTRACRMFARAGFYQVGGAYGFRDQLQDVMALMVAAPRRRASTSCARAAHQFAARRCPALVASAAGRGCGRDFPTTACSCRLPSRTT